MGEAAAEAARAAAEAAERAMSDAEDARERIAYVVARAAVGLPSSA